MLFPTRPPQYVIDEIERAFYAGTVTMMTYLLQHTDEKVAMAQLESLTKEIQDFSAKQMSLCKHIGLYDLVIIAAFATKSHDGKSNSTILSTQTVHHS